MRGREHPELSHVYRTEFQRDRARIIHSKAFRRLEYKTQVFLNGTGDHLRTRLTHSIEVASISRTIARALSLNEDLAEAIALANSTAYGLSAIAYTGSQVRAERVGRALRAGTVWVNTFLVRDLTAPFGGIGISGIGREGGDYALDFYSDLKTLQILDG